MILKVIEILLYVMIKTDMVLSLPHGEMSI